MTLPGRLASDLLACIRFYSRLPVPVFAFEGKPHEMLDFSRAVRMLPLAGAIIALPAALVLLLTSEIGLAPSLVAGFTLAASVLTTGAFHEDGLADTADGFGGGSTIDRKLEIMRDSRIGSYGGVALVLALLLRWAALVTLLGDGAIAAAACWIALAGLTRTFALAPLALLPPARRDGAAYAAAQPDAGALCVAALLALMMLSIAFAAGMNLLPIGFAAVMALGGSLAVTWLSARQIKGQTGDVAGAAQQVAEVLGLTMLGLHL